MLRRPSRLLSTLAIHSSAADKLRALRTRHGPERYLRVEVRGGGCHGFQYAFRIDASVDPQEDHIIANGGDAMAVVVDRASTRWLQGSTLVYANVSKSSPLMGRHFAVQGNPQADSGCGCGVSFGLKPK